MRARRITFLCGVLWAVTGCAGAIDDPTVASDPPSAFGADAGPLLVPTRTPVPDASEPLPDGGAASGEIPCSVASLLRQHCAACHSDPPRSGAPSPLLSRSDLLAPALSEPTRSFAELALERMADPARPMPPAPSAQVPEAEQRMFEAWVTSGAAPAPCGMGQPVDPYDTPTQCSTDSFWTEGDDGSPGMLPGRPCVSCHDDINAEKGEIEAPPLWLGGTVYATAHEPNDCLGSSGPALVDVTDADGMVFRMEVGASGNFRWERSAAAVVFPITATVTYEGRTRAMTTPAPHGDCNACHTVQGQDGAPGRVMLP